MKSRYYVLTGVLIYALFLISNTPATIIQRFDAQLPQFKLQTPGGTLWNGHAQRLTISSRHIIDNPDWSFCGWRLLLGELCVDLNASYLDTPFSAQISAGIAGSFRVSTLTVEADAQKLGELMGLPIGKLSGTASSEINTAVWQHGSVPSADGVITWKNAAITVAETASLGTVSIVLSESDEYPLTATINNKGGHIALNGSVNVLENGAYSLELNLTPNNQATNNLRNSLSMFAQKQANGSFVLKNSGNLKQYGLM